MVQSLLTLSYKKNKVGSVYGLQILYKVIRKMNLDMQTINHWLKINSLNDNDDSAVEDVCVMKISAEIML